MLLPPPQRAWVDMYFTLILPLLLPLVLSRAQTLRAAHWLLQPCVWCRYSSVSVPECSAEAQGDSSSLNNVCHVLSPKPWTSPHTYWVRQHPHPESKGDHPSPLFYSELLPPFTVRSMCHLCMKPFLMPTVGSDLSCYYIALDNCFLVVWQLTITSLYC